MKKYIKIFLMIIWMISGLYMNGHIAYATTSDAINSEQNNRDLEDLVASGLYVSSDNILYIADSYNNQIFQYDGNEITLVAGNQNLIEGIPSPGYIDGKVEYTLFDSPYAAVTWKEGIVVSDTGNQVLRYISNGVAVTYTEEVFVSPTGLATDDSGNLYLADSGAGIIYIINEDNEVSPYVEDLNGPRGLYWYENTLYVTDMEANQILGIQDGEVTVVAGKEVQDGEEWLGGYLDGAASEALFSLPEALYIDETGIYVGDVGNNAIRKIIDNVVYTVYMAENIVDPSAIVKYDGQLIVGDTFLRTTQEIQEKDVELPSTTGTGDVSAEETDNGDNEKGFNIWLVVGILAVVLILLIGIIVCIIVREKKKTDYKSEALPQEEELPQEKLGKEDEMHQEK